MKSITTEIQIDSFTTIPGIYCNAKRKYFSVVQFPPIYMKLPLFHHPFILLHLESLSGDVLIPLDVDWQGNQLVLCFLNRWKNIQNKKENP